MPVSFLRCLRLLAATPILVAAGTVQGAEDTPQSTPSPHAEYAGDARCAECHAEQANSYRDTAHAHTTQWPSETSVHGDFRPGHNQLRTANPRLYFSMEAKDGALTQTAVVRTSATDVLTRTESIGVVVGSGRKGQSYLFWDGNDLFQLPVSYWTELNRWVNSPGYVDGLANFDRQIDARCLECHASSFASEAPTINRYRRDSLVLGLTCERCHGPGEAHAAAYAALPKPAAGSATLIVNPKKIPRDRQMDVCALCHAGIGQSTTPPLSFKPGDQLDHHLVFPPVDPNAPLDVHASQIQLLKQSRCYAGSQMTCATCHDVHHTQRDVVELATKCLACHRVESCGEFAKRGKAIATGCVECHMPLQATAQIVSTVDGRSLQPKVRNHRIAVYGK